MPRPSRCCATANMCGSKSASSCPRTRAGSSPPSLSSFFNKWVDYDFTANLEEQLDRVSNHEIDWRVVLRDFWTDFSAALGETKELRTTEVLDNLNELLGPHIFPPRADGLDPRLCPACNSGQLSLKLGKFGAFVGLLELSRVQVHADARRDRSRGRREGEKPGQRSLGTDPATRAGGDGARRPLRRLYPARRGREAEALVAAQGRHAGDDRSRHGAGAARRCRARWPSTRFPASRSLPASAAMAPMCSTAAPTPISAMTTTCWRSAATGPST